jgi:hypothetical protein
VDDDLEAVRAIFESDEPRHELEPFQRRLLRAFGAGYVVDDHAPPCERCAREECRVSSRLNERVSAVPLSMASLGNNSGANWEPNWIDYRTSVANVDRRRDRNETVATCSECGCETDVSPAPHSPKCPTLSAFGAPPDGRELLARMDAGERVGLEEASGPIGAGPDVSSSPKPGPVQPAPTPEGEERRPAGGGASGSRSKWTRERVITAIREVGETVGHTPSSSEMQKAGHGAALFAASKSGHLGKGTNIWPDLVREAGFEPNTRGTGGTRREKQRSGRAATSAPTPRPDESAARPAESEPEPEAETDAASRGGLALERPVSPPSPAGEQAASGSEIQVLDLVRLIEDIDTGAITVTRWKDGDGDHDEASGQRIRQIARDSLGGYGAAEIGIAVLDYIDREAT